jgi:hypothetical protein
VLTPGLRRLAAGAAVLVVDGAMWGRRLPHALGRWIRERCPHAGAAFDGMTITIPAGRRHREVRWMDPRALEE